MTDDPLPDSDAEHIALQEKLDADYIQFRAENMVKAHEAAQNHRATEIRLEVAKAMIPVMGQMSVGKQSMRIMLDWWVDWITGGLDD